MFFDPLYFLILAPGLLLALCWKRLESMERRRQNGNAPVAMYLHRLGAARARSLTFVADGGVWIWERIATIVRLAKLENVPRYEVLDCYHATHHVSLALAALKLDDELRLTLYRGYRTLLRNGHWRQVVEELGQVAENALSDSKVWIELPTCASTARPGG